MLRRLLSLAIVAFLALPAAALAADPIPAPPATGHYYYLAAVEQGGRAIKVEGKLWIEGDQLGASVGCNSIGAKVRFDLRTLTILGDVSTTLIGCPKDRASAEAVLIAALGAGPFSWDGSGFVGTGARLVASQAGSGPVTPVDQQPPDKLDPNGTVSSPVVEPGSFDLDQCRSYVSQKEWDAAFGTGLTGSGTRDGTSGSGSASSGSSGVGTTIDAGAGGSGASDSAGTGKKAQPTSGAIEPAPAPSAVSKPNGRPTSAPSLIAVQVAPAPGVVGGPATDPGTAVAPAPPIDLPVAEPGRKPPAGTSSGPAPTPSTESCRALLARIRTMAASAPTVDLDKASAAAELARDAVNDSQVPPALPPMLVLATGLLLLAWLRSIPGRPARD